MCPGRGGGRACARHPRFVEGLQWHGCVVGSTTEDIESACSDPDQEEAAQIVEAVGNEGEADQEATDGDDEEGHGASQLHQLRQNISSEQLFKALYSEWEMGLLASGDEVHISALNSAVDGSLKTALKDRPS